MVRSNIASVNGVPADLIDAQDAGRLVITPHPLTLDGQKNIIADVQPNENLLSFLHRHIPGIGAGAGWCVMISGAIVPPSMWRHTYPKPGQLIACRAVLGKSAMHLVATATLSYFTMGMGGLAGGAFMGLKGFTGFLAASGAFAAGSMLINKVLGPKISKSDTQTNRQFYSLSSQRNTSRPYEPIPVLWGEMRVTPDSAGTPYTWFEGDDQYLSTILLGGINVHAAADLSVGDTPLDRYDDVHVYYNALPGMPNQNVPLYSNADSIAGADLDYKSQAWVTRTSSADTVVLAVDIEGQLFDTGGSTAYGPKTVTLYGEYKQGTGTEWHELFTDTITNSTPDTVRRSYTTDVPSGQYDVRVRCGKPTQEMDNSDTCRFVWVTLRSIQPDPTDYAQWGRIGIKIRATGQLNGNLDTLRVTYRARPLPVWTGTQWISASTRADGLSNPGAIILQTLRGIRDDDGNLQFGLGLDDAQIDIDGLKSFMLHCAAHGYTYDRWIVSEISIGNFLAEVALAGMGEFSWTDGSRPTVVFVSSGQPISAVVNMANMLKSSFSVDYTLHDAAADGIEYQYVDREQNWETKTLRVSAPGVTTMLNPARITGEGVTTASHAAVLARYHLAQSLYQYKTVSYVADIEHLDYRRLSVLSISHDLTQWGFGGRLLDARINGGRVQLILDDVVPVLPTPFIGLRLPGDREWRVFAVQPLAAPANTIMLDAPWPSDCALPGDHADNPAHDTLWCMDFKPTPGYRVRVISMSPEPDLSGAKISCVPESSEFWNYVINGVYEPAPNHSSLHKLRPQAQNLRVTEKIHHQGGTEWYELQLTWDITGDDYDYAQIWVGRDGSQMHLVDARAVVNRSTFRIDGPGQYLIQVVPFGISGMVGNGASLLYTTAGVALPPANPDVFTVDQVDGGLRMFGWSYTGHRPLSLAGVQIRYLPGDVPLPPEKWPDMYPVGHAGDIYTAEFQTTRPAGAGTWSFGLRAINTSGQLATHIVRRVVTLSAPFDFDDDDDDDDDELDLTPPPSPTGFSATAALTSATLQTDRPSYTQGHGHAATHFYAATVTPAQPNPAFSNAQLVLASIEHIGSTAVALGKTYRFWATWKSVDGIESAPAGPVTLKVGMIDNQDLGPLIIEAGNLAKNAVSAFNLTDGMDLVGVATGDTLPIHKTSEIITWGGKIYRWDGTKYTAMVPTVDLSGTINAQQIADNAVTVSKIAADAVTEAKLATAAVTADKLAQASVDATKFARGIEPVRVIDSNYLPTVKNTNVITWDGKIYRWDGTKYTTAVPSIDISGQLTDAQIASINAAKLSGQITGTQISNGAITTPKIAAGSISAAQIAAGAVSAEKIAALSITAEKIAADAVTARALAANSVTADSIAANAVTTAAIAAGAVSADQIAAYAITAVKIATNSVIAAKIAAGAVSAEKIAAGAVSAEKIAALSITAEKIAANAVTTTHISAGAVTAVKIAALSITAEKIAAGAITSDKIYANAITSAAIATGAITAAKIAANAIAVGTAAIQNGAIVNAMIGNLSADKINTGTLAAARIAAGSIDATKIAANAITTDKISANSITAAKLASGSITADKISATTLSAISANLGTVTAGLIRNNGNTSFWDLGATGSKTQFKLGNDLTFDSANGLVVNKLSVIGTAQIANNAITQTFTKKFTGNLNTPGNHYSFTTDSQGIAVLIFDGAFFGKSNGDSTYDIRLKMGSTTVWGSSIPANSKSSQIVAFVHLYIGQYHVYFANKSGTGDDPFLLNINQFAAIQFKR